MPRIVRGGLIQAALSESATSPIEKIKRSMVDKHVAMIGDAAKRGAQVICLQELFYGPYFCAEQEIRVVFAHRAHSRRADNQIDDGTGQKARHLPRRAHLRGRLARDLLQHRRGHRRRRLVPGQVP